MMTGDFIGHNIPIEPEDEDQPELYTLLEQVQTQMAELVVEFMPNAIFLPTLGNNDWKYHYQSPYESTKYEFYSLMFDNWFAKHPRNSQLPNLDQIRTTFLNGGYYRVDLSPKVSFLGLNTLMFNRKNNNSLDGNQVQDQLAWIEMQFYTAEPDRQFILSNHIYPGAKVEDQLRNILHGKNNTAIIQLI